MFRIMIIIIFIRSTYLIVGEAERDTSCSGIEGFGWKVTKQKNNQSIRTLFITWSYKGLMFRTTKTRIPRKSFLIISILMDTLCWHIQKMFHDLHHHSGVSEYVRDDREVEF